MNLIGHPGLVQVFEFGELPTGGAFMVMEFIPGTTLRDRLKQSERLAEMEALQVALQLASALAAAHSKDIVHRDLKPGNVMLVQDPTMPMGQRVKLLDFGVAKLGAQSAHEDQPRTKTGLSIGTPTYMSPEQCRGLKTIDGRSDVYALGVMLYEMLSGRLPFEGDAEGAILGMHMYEEPPPILSIAPQVSLSVAALVHRMLHKKADERPTAQEVVEVLTEMAAAVVPASARPSTRLAAVAGPRATGELMAQGSTLGRGVGQLAKGRSLRLRHAILRFSERWPWLAEHSSPRQRLILAAALGLLCIVAISGGISAVLRGSRNQRVASQPELKVRWSVHSTPAGASIIRRSDQTVLGQTPWQKEQPSAQGVLELVLRLSGYKDRVIQLDQSRDVQINESLEAEAAPTSPPPAGASGLHKGGKRSKERAKDKDKDKDKDSDTAKRAKGSSRTRLID